MSNKLGVIALAVTAMFLSSFMTHPAAAQEKKKILFLTKSTGFQHPVVKRSETNPEKLSFAEQMRELVPRLGPLGSLDD